MAEQSRQPRNIFELINQNIVDLSNDMVALYHKVDEIHSVLFPTDIAPTASGVSDEVRGELNHSKNELQ